MKDANYYDTFIEVAADCPASTAQVPASKSDGPSIPALQYEMIARNPYQYTQEDVLFEVYAKRQSIPRSAWAAEREKFFSKGQACLRSSALGKRYGWGIHCNAEGKVALFAVESKEYRAFANNGSLKHLKALRSKRG